MATTLSPKAKLWTKWHQERANNNEMERDTSNDRNQRYMEIVREVVDRQFQPKLLEWALTSTLGENSKKVSLHIALPIEGE